MRNLLKRIWRYLNYPADTHGKVDEILQRARELHDPLPQLQKLSADSENLKVKISAAEIDLRYLKTLIVAVQNQLNSIQNHLRTGQPWLPPQQRFLRNPESLLLSHLAVFLQNPSVTEVGLHDDIVVPVLLNAGFKLCLLESHSPTAAKLRGQYRDTSSVQVLETGVEGLGALAETQNVQIDSGVLRINTPGLDPELVRYIGELRPEIIEIALPAERPAEVHPGESASEGGNLVRQMRARGYRWSLLLFEVEGEQGVRFAANSDGEPVCASGNFFFFKDSRLFDEAYRWTRSVMPRFQYREASETWTRPSMDADGHG